jgi:hypothetical protein
MVETRKGMNPFDRTQTTMTQETIEQFDLPKKGQEPEEIEMVIPVVDNYDDDFDMP